MLGTEIIQTLATSSGFVAIQFTYKTEKECTRRDGFRTEAASDLDNPINERCSGHTLVGDGDGDGAGDGRVPV